MNDRASPIIIRADARNLPLPDASVDLIVTSPPYFALRSYTDGGEHYAGQIGSESTPAEYIAALLACTAEWVRVLKPSGSLLVNLGDKYAQDNERSRNGHSGHLVGANPLRTGAVYSGPRDNGVPRKSLMGLPWRYALGCIDQLGLILRAELIWSKPNGLPESVTDRVRRSHEQWFHFTRLPRYFAAVDEIREAYAPGTAERYRSDYTQTSASRSGQTLNGVVRMDNGGPSSTNPLGKLPGSVWDIPSEPLTVPDHLGVDHFAAFPSEWPKRLILGWSPSGICTVCGEGRRPIVIGGRNGDGSKPHKAAQRVSSFDWAAWKESTPHTISGYSCACPSSTAPTTPAIVLDPFGGTGTTALAASALGRIGISIDRSADYNRLAQWRTRDPGQRAKVLGVPKPPIQIDGQGDLLTDLEPAS